MTRTKGAAAEEVAAARGLRHPTRDSTQPQKPSNSSQKDRLLQSPENPNLPHVVARPTAVGTSGRGKIRSLWRPRPVQALIALAIRGSSAV